jgi:hypothetical protein
MIALKSEPHDLVPQGSNPTTEMINTMAEAKRSIPQIPTIHITTAAHCLAQLRARNAVKHQLRKQGLKVSHYAARDITAMACEYLSEHRSELTPDAIETITRWTLAMSLSES